MPVFEFDDAFKKREVKLQPKRKAPTPRYGSADSLERKAQNAPKYGSADSLERRALTATPPPADPPHLRAANLVTWVPEYLGVGVPNPYGAGASAFEPETELYDPGVNEPLLKGYDDAYNAVQRSRADEAAQAAETITVQAGVAGAGAPSGPVIKADGRVGSMIDAAKSMLGKPYIWGGTTARGVDCSGLLYYAFNQAGIKMPRYVASQYGKMGRALSPEEARAGDIVYWDNPGSVDHVGIYIGDGQVIQAPTTGDVVKISKVWKGAQFRRIVDDAAFGQQPTPTGGTVTSYKGKPATVDRMLGIKSTVQFN